MEERKIEITLDGQEHQVFAGNAALRRFHRAGGSMLHLEGPDRDSSEDETPENNPASDEGEAAEVSGGKETNKDGMNADEAFKYAEALALLIRSNLVKPGNLTIDDIFNGTESVAYLIRKGEEIFSGVPWLKNQAAAGTVSK